MVIVVTVLIACERHLFAGSCSDVAPECVTAKHGLSSEETCDGPRMVSTLLCVQYVPSRVQDAL